METKGQRKKLDKNSALSKSTTQISNKKINPKTNLNKTEKRDQSKDKNQKSQTWQENSNFLHAASHAIDGLKELYRQRAFRSELILFIVLIIYSILFNSIFNYIAIGLCFVVLMFEAINSSIEELCNQVNPNYNKNIKKIKDMASVPVFLLLIVILILLLISFSQQDYRTKFIQGFIKFYHNFNAALHPEKRYTELEGSVELEYILVSALTILLSWTLVVRKKLKAVFLLGIITLLIHFYLSIFLVTRVISAESFFEAQSFRMSDFNAWVVSLKTIQFPVYNREINVKIVVFSVQILILRLIFKKFYKYLNIKITSYAVNTVFWSLIVIGLFLTFDPPVRAFYSSLGITKSIEDNQSQAPLVDHQDTGLKLVVYVGESTTDMNFSLYGYHRKTTPKLDNLQQEKQLLVFHNVFPTFCFTQDSLYQALTFGIDAKEKYFNIYRRKRQSLTDFLYKNGIESHLFSTQGDVPAHKLVNNTVLKNANKNYSFFSILSYFAPDSDQLVKDEYFTQNLPGYFTKMANDKKNNVVFLHSAAGHAGYDYWIPKEFRKNIDDYYGPDQNSRLFGSSLAPYLEIESYDRAMRYIDDSLGSIIKLISKEQKPYVFIYFADHGEAPYQGSNHVVSRFVQEMLRIPFFIYFNDAAKKTYPELYQKYKKLSESREIATLDQFASTLLDLMGFDLNRVAKAGLITYPPIGSPVDHIDPILIQDFGSQYKYLNLNQQPISAPTMIKVPYNELLDPGTEIFKAVYYHSTPSTKICYDRTNTVAMAVRGLYVSDCIKSDLHINANGELRIFPREGQDIGLSYQVYDRVNQNQRKPEWHHINTEISQQQCVEMAKQFSLRPKNAGKIMIEFSSKNFAKSSWDNDCANLLKKQGYELALELEPASLLACKSELDGGAKFENSAPCTILNDHLRSLANSPAITTISIDYNGLAAVKASGVAARFRWNLYNLRPALLQGLDLSRFSHIALLPDDGNDFTADFWKEQKKAAN